MLKIRKKDRVMIMAGKDKGKVSDVLRVFPDKMRVLVSQVNIVTKHRKRTQNDLGRIDKMEAPVSYSNVMLMCPKCEKPSRVGLERLPSGDVVRVCRRCEQQIE